MREAKTTNKIQYIRDNFATEDGLLKEVAGNVEQFGVKGMQVGAEEGKFLQFLVRSFNIKNVVELGTLGGYSSIWMARGMVAGGKIHTIEYNHKHYELAKNMVAKSDVAEKIELHFGDAAEILKKLEPLAPFDMIFIDADKSGYTKYLDWAEKFIRKGGLIVGDNTFLFDTVYCEQAPEKVSKNSHAAMREFNKRLADTSKYHSIMLPTEEGMTIAVKLT